ncbi:MAG: BLUF domain-containing protein [Pseudomonadota bacterium]
MPLYTLTYISKAPQMRGDVRRQFINALVKQADGRNIPLGVSGCLVHVDDFFMQVLEGPRGDVSDTYNRIARDERHDDVHIVCAEPLISRQFPLPSLAVFDIESEDNPVFAKYRVGPQFSPYLLAPDALGDLLDQIALVCSKLDSVNRKGRDKAA